MSTVTEIETVPDMMEKVSPVVLRATEFQIRTHQDFEACVLESKVVKDFIAEVEKTFADPKKKAHEAHKSIVAAEKRHLDPLVAADKILKDKMVAWTDEQERIRKAEEERLRKEREEEERKRREALEAELAEKRRIEEERLAKERAEAEAARKKAEDEALEKARKLEEAGAKEEAERALKRAAAQAELDRIMAETREAERKLEAAKEEERVREVLSAPVYVPQVSVPAAPKVSGFSTAKIWSAEVRDLRLLCRAVADGKVSPDAVLPNMPFLNKIAKAHHSEDFGYPGVVGKVETSGRTSR